MPNEEVKIGTVDGDGADALDHPHANRHFAHGLLATVGARRLACAAAKQDCGERGNRQCNLVSLVHLMLLQFRLPK